MGQWKSTFFAVYIIPNDLRELSEAEIDSKIEGKEIKINRKISGLFSEMFVASKMEIPVRFTSENNQQRNEVRSQLMKMAFQPEYCNSIAKWLAIKLIKVTDQRVNKSALVILTSEEIENGKKKNYKIVLWKLPTDEDIIKIVFEAETPNLEKVQNAFLKRSEFFKGMLIYGKDESEFWEGYITDNQVSTKGDISKYWITDFLTMRKILTDKRGTYEVLQKIAKLQKIANTEESGELNTLASTLPLKKKEVSLLEISQEVPEKLQKNFIKGFDEDELKAPFKLDKKHLKDNERYKRVLIHAEHEIIELKSPIEVFHLIKIEPNGQDLTITIQNAKLFKTLTSKR